jgi:hypothetical protein
MKDSHLTLRLPADLARALARRARSLGLPKSHIAREAVARYLVPVTAEKDPPVGISARALLERWGNLPRLAPDEAETFAADIAESRESLPAVRSPWE